MKSSAKLSLGSYSVAATAVASIYAAGQANAEVYVYDNGGIGWSASGTDKTLISFSLAGEVGTDGNVVPNAQFNITQTYKSPAEDTSNYHDKINLTGVNTPSAGGQPQISTTRLGGGATIGATENTPSATSITLTGTQAGSPKGTWAPGDRGYAGLAFYDAPTSTRYYGWADITVHDSSSVTLNAYAYESIANGSIVTPIPEPTVSTLMLVAGAGGVVALRHRRKKQAEAKAKA